MVPEFGSWEFIFLSYLLVGWFVVRHAEKSYGDETGHVYPWYGFLFCLILWVPILIIGFVAGIVKGIRKPK